MELASGAAVEQYGRLAVEERVPIDAEIARLRADSTEIRTRLAQLERAMHKCREATDDLSGSALSPASGDEEPSADIARLKAVLAAREQRLVEVEAAARGQIAALSEALATIEESIAWRATAPLRAAAAALPQPVRLAFFRVARGVYWALTPHRMPARLEWLLYAPQMRRTVKRLESLSEEVRSRLGTPLRRSYGPSPIERLDVYPAARPDAPVFVFVHGGAWREGEAGNYAFPAELFVNAGAHYVVLDFIGLKEAGGDLRIMAEQVRRGIAWVYRNAASFGGDRDRIFVGGHSSGAHLCAIALVSDRGDDVAVPADTVKGALLMSGVFDMKPVRQSRRNAYLRLTDEIEQAMSARRHVGLLHVPVVITYGTYEPPEFQQQSRDFFTALKDAGKPAELLEAANFNHMDMMESLSSPYGPNGRAALALMKL